MADDQPIIEISWNNGKLQLYKKFIRLDRTTWGAFLRWPDSNWRKDIFFKNIVAISINNIGILEGSINFSLVWGNIVKKKGFFSNSYTEEQKDENTITFFWKKNWTKALQIKKYIEDHMTIEAQNQNEADEIEKLRNLMKKWIITEKEFKSKKKKILG